jgi:hypothetical protein
MAPDELSEFDIHDLIKRTKHSDLWVVVRGTMIGLPLVIAVLVVTFGGVH